MKREHSPYNPYKRKAKGKETSPGFLGNPLSPRGRAHAREGISRYRLAGGAADELIAILGAPPTRDNRHLWAYYCYHHDIEIILEEARRIASLHRLGELDNAVTAFQHWLSDSFGEGGAR